MAVDSQISLAIVKKELEDCKENVDRYGWEISDIDEAGQTFTVKMKSSIDKEVYTIEIRFDDYNQYPLNIEFIDPVTGQKGSRNSYPKPSKTEGSFFHGMSCICHPCSRKAYGPNGPHSNPNDWKMADWQKNPKAGSLINIRAILEAIHFRINDPEHYNGRVK